LLIHFKKIAKTDLIEQKGVTDWALIKSINKKIGVQKKRV